MIIEGENLEKFRYLVAWQGLCMETKYGMSSYGGANCYRWVKENTGLTGTRKTILPKYAEWMVSNGIILEDDEEFMRLTESSLP